MRKAASSARARSSRLHAVDESVVARLRSSNCHSSVENRPRAARSSCPREEAGRAPRWRARRWARAGRGGLRFVRGGELPFEPCLVGPEPSGRTEGDASLADQTRPQRQPTGLVWSRPGNDGGNEIVDALTAERRPDEAHAEADVLLQAASSSVERSAQELPMRASPLIRRMSIGSSTRTFAFGAMSAMVVCTTASSPRAGRTWAM